MSDVTITAADVKALRERTGAGLMDCKKALQEAGGDQEKAVELLRVKLGNKVGKLATRETTEGTVQAFVSEDGTRGAIVEVDCNTDFVARNDDFVAFAQRLAQEIAAEGASGALDVEALLQQNGADGRTYEAQRAELSAGTGENVVIRRAERLVAEGEGNVAAYIHATGKVGVAVLVEGGGTGEARASFAREVAVHVAAMPTKYITPDDVPQDARDAELRVYAQQAEAEGKPEQIREKIALGKLSKWLKEITLLPQEHINPDKHAGKTIDQLRQDVGEGTVIRSVARFQVGE